MVAPVVSAWYSEAERELLNKQVSSYSTGRRVEQLPIHNTYTVQGWRTDYTRADEYNAVLAKNNAVVMTCINAYNNAIMQARLMLVDGQDNEVQQHPFLDVMQQPNDQETYRDYISQKTYSKIVNGNDYTLPLADDRGQVIGIQSVPFTAIEIYYYRDQDYSVRKIYRLWRWHAPTHLDPSEIAHGIWRHRDNTNLYGESPLQPLYDELKLDHAANVVARGRLENPAIGLVIKRNDLGRSFNQRERKSEEEALQSRTGLGSGGPYHLGLGEDVIANDAPMQRFDFSKTSAMAERRVCAELGLPDAWLGLGTDPLALSRQASLVLEQHAWMHGFIPYLERLADDLTRQILPWFPFSEGLRVKFDTSHLDWQAPEDRAIDTQRNFDLADRNLLSREQLAEREGLDPTQLPPEEVDRERDRPEPTEG